MDKGEKNMEVPVTKSNFKKIIMIIIERKVVDSDDGVYSDVDDNDDPYRQQRDW